MSFSNMGGASLSDIAALLGNRDGDGFMGGDGLLFILFILILFGNNNGNWGNGTADEVQSGFDQQAVMGGIAAVQNSIITASSEQLAAMNQLAMSLQSCCCENRLATANLNAAIASENCATRQTFSDGLRDMMVQNTANTQALMNTLTTGFQGLHDEFCQTRLDAKNDKIADLQRQVEEANDNARYQGLIAAFNQSQEAQTTAIEQYLNPTARPCYVVPNPNGCNCPCNQF